MATASRPWQPGARVSAENKPCLAVDNIKSPVGTRARCSIYVGRVVLGARLSPAEILLLQVAQGAVDEEKVEALKREAEAVMGDK